MGVIAQLSEMMRSAFLGLDNLLGQGRIVRVELWGAVGVPTIGPDYRWIGIDPAGLLKYLTRKERGFYQVMGTSQAIREAVVQLGRGFLKGISAANRLFHPIPG